MHRGRWNSRAILENRVWGDDNRVQSDFTYHFISVQYKGPLIYPTLVQ